MSQNTDVPLGVSCVLCCYNSAERLPQTLNHLLRQRVPAHIPWEVIVIDNRSTDTTADTARSIWKDNTTIPFRVVREDRPGVNYARCRAFEEARYDFVSFIDDDNWVNEDWISLVYEILSGDRSIGACGGLSTAVFEKDPPGWFEKYQGFFAIGSQAAHSGYMSDKGVLWGAGLTIRKCAWQFLQQRGFSFQAVDRCGNKLGSGGDVELVCAVKLTGKRLFYDERLQLGHFITASRLTLDYVRKLAWAMGFTSPFVDPYDQIAVERDGKRPSVQERVLKSTPVELVRMMLFVIYTKLRLLLRCQANGCQPSDEDYWSILSAMHSGRLAAIWQRRSTRQKTMRELRRIFLSDISH